MPSLLFVDPDPKFAGSLAELFQSRGFEATTAESGEAARALLAHRRFDLILTEIRLPGISGFDLVREARAVDAHQAFAVLTSGENFFDALEAIRLGAREYLVKHLDRVDFLVESLQRVVERLYAERESRELLARVTEVHDQLLKSLVHLEKENVQLEERLGQSAPMGLTDYCILIVDDEPLVSAVLKELFSEHGFEAVVAGSVAEAIARIDAGGVHLVFADKNLPDRSGLEVLKHVKTHHPEVEVVMMTGYGSLESAIQALDVGAAGYVLKPFDDLQELLRKVRDIRKKQEFRVKAVSFLARFKRKNHAFIEKYEQLRRRLLELQASG